MDFSIFFEIFNWKNELNIAAFIVYITPLFIIMDEFCVRNAISKKLDLKSTYYDYQRRNGFFSSLFFKVIFWILLLTYIRTAFIFSPLIVVMALIFYFITVSKIAVLYFKRSNKEASPR